MNEQAIKICITLLENESTPTDLHVREAIEKVGRIFTLTDAEKEELLHIILANFGIYSHGHKTLDSKEGYIPWIKASKGHITWSFWNRYQSYMSFKVARDTLNKMDNLTDDILDRIGNPSWSGNWDKRGLVVGQVQSGKTGNYIGLINKAADCGYKLIIVLAGMHDSLRSQTQIRIDEGFMGYDTQRSLQYSSHHILGVGKYNPKDPVTNTRKELPVHALTSGHINGDFNQGKILASTNLRGSDPVVAVVKKNPSILNNLIFWLARWGTKTTDGKLLIQNLPVLVIDDEADNASINVNKYSVSKINGFIRALLSLFEQSAYVGYTATPFANVFIPIQDTQNSKGLDITIRDFAFKVGDDLFPKNFIINIPAPSNYIGPALLFGLNSSDINRENDVFPLPLVRDISNYDPEDFVFVPDKHKKNSPLPTRIPESLKYALRCFILVVTARRARKQFRVHNSMLIHVSRFIRWQDHISVMVDQELKFYQRQIDQNTGNLLSDLRSLWLTEFVDVTDTILARKDIFQDRSITKATWEEVEPHLKEAIMSIEVRAIHGDKNLSGLQYHNITPLDYFIAEQSGSFLNIIAIGGDKLSRGLTLEGLSVSYFLRASKMYDTLMQMGRWFGYRPGYMDLCRVFTTNDLINWYRHITIASEEMRSEFDYMFHLRRTPQDYGLKVRTHPGVLKITAANKFQYHTRMWLSYSGSLEQTYEFELHENRMTNNFEATKTLLSKLGGTTRIPNNENRSQEFFWKGNNNHNLITTFLRNYQINQTVMDVRKIADYIEKQTSHGNLLNWNILLVNNSLASNDRKVYFPGLSKPVGLTDRTNQSIKEDLYQVSKANITDQRHEMVDLTIEQITKSLEATIADYEYDYSSNNDNKGEYKVPVLPTRPRIRQQRPESDGLIIIYPLSSDPYHLIKKESSDKEKVRRNISTVPIIGLAISFPEISRDEKIEYAVNEQFKMEYDYPNDLDEADEYDRAN